MFVVKGNGTLDGGVADHVAVGEVLSDNAGARLVFLLNILLVARAIVGVSAGQVTYARSAGDVNLRVAQLGIVKKKGCLCGPR